MAKATKSIGEQLAEASQAVMIGPLFKPSDAELKKQFGYHPATEVTGPKHDQVRAACLVLARKITALVPDCPEAQLAVLKVREAMFHANAAIACRTPLPKGK